VTYSGRENVAEPAVVLPRFAYLFSISFPSFPPQAWRGERFGAYQLIPLFTRSHANNSFREIDPLFVLLRPSNVALALSFTTVLASPIS